MLAVLPAFANLASERIFEEEKSLLLRAAAVVALPGAVAAWRRHGARLSRHAVVLGFAALVVWLVAATVAGTEYRDAFFGAYLKRHGLVTWLALGVLLAAMSAAAESADGRDRLIRAIAIGSIWPSASLLLQRAGLDPIHWIAPTAGFKPGGTFGNHVYIGGYLAVVIPLTAIQLTRSRAWIALLAVQVAALAASGSRGAMIGFASGALVAAAAVCAARLPRRTFVAAVVAFGLAAASVMLVPAARRAALDRFDPAVGSARVRVLIWQQTIALARDSGLRLWIGNGPESLRRLFPRYYSPEIGRLEKTDAIPDRAHNELLDTLVNGGIAGVLLEMIVFAAIIAGALRLTDVALRAGLAAAGVAHVVEIQFGIATVVARLLLVAIAACVIGASRSHAAAAVDAARTRGARRRQMPPVPSRTPVWILLAALAAIGAVSPLLSLL
ncbi:MAG TPA: O-antigen ligase family protein, partial [Vicinamibacterales bacterium]|nr:O-antigen ligase family protein [Vicinamibacterales bacterium]